MQDSINALRSQLSFSQKEGELSARDLREAREEVAQKARQLKAKLSLARAAERTQLTNLTMHSNNATKKLQDVIGNVCPFITHSQTQLANFTQHNHKNRLHKSPAESENNDN